MRLSLPLTLRRHVVEALHDAFDEPSCAAIRDALAPVCAHFRVAVPRVRWMTRAQRRSLYGFFKDPGGVIGVMHPTHWRRQKRKNTEEEWLKVLLHETAHYLMLERMEKRADQFALDFLAET